MATEGKTILLVEDEGFLALSETALLEDEGFIVRWARSGEEAVDLFREHGPAIDLVLMDINLGPGMSGVDAAARMLGMRDVPVVFLSAYCDRKTLAETGRISSYGYVTKGAGETALLAALNTAFSLFESRARERREATFSEEVVRQAQEGIIVYDTELRYVVWNPAMERLTGVSANRVLGKRVYDIFSHIRAQGVDRMLEAALRGDTLRSGDLFFEVTETGRQGWYAATYGPHRDAEGRIIGVIATIRDITDRKDTEESLRMQELTHRETLRLIRLMADNMPDLLWAKDLQKRFLFANRAICERLLHAADLEEPLGKTDMFFALRERNIHPERKDWHTFGEICRDSDDVVMESGRAERFDEYGNVRGEFLHLDVYKAPIFDEAGGLIGTVGCGRDVTHEKKVEADLRRTLDEKDVLQHELQHRVRNNLNLILSLISLRLRKSDDPATRDALKEIGDRIGAIALIYEKTFRSGQPAEVNMRSYLGDLATSVFRSSLDEAHRIRLVSHIEAITLDLRRAVPCGLILNELLTNALKYAFPDGRTGTVELAFSLDGALCVLQVKDDGAGIDEGAASALRRASGLRIVETLARQLDGTMTLEASGGVTVRVAFPR